MVESTKVNGVYNLYKENEEKLFSMVSNHTCLSISDKNSNHSTTLSHLNKSGMTLLKQGLATGLDVS